MCLRSRSTVHWQWTLSYNLGGAEVYVSSISITALVSKSDSVVIVAVCLAVCLSVYTITQKIMVKST